MVLRQPSNYFTTHLNIQRYATHGNIPISVVFCKDNKIKWSQTNNLSPYNFISVHTEVPEKSIASKYFRGKSLPSSISVILANTWFTDKFVREDLYFYEQCHVLENFNSIISFIWESKNYNL
jgi:hypothetical protein